MSYYSEYIKRRKADPKFRAAFNERHAAYQRAQRADSLKGEKMRARDRKAHAADPRGSMLTAAKVRAKRDGAPFSLKRGEVIVPEFCPALGIRLTVGKGRQTNSSPTLDRVIPELGYVSGNVRVISYRANRIKNDATCEELFSLAVWIEQQTEIKSNG